MKKLIFLLMSLFLVSTLVACDGETQTEQKDIGSVETSSQLEDENTDTDVEDETNADTETEEKEFNQVIADNENLKATLISIEKVVDTFWEEEYYNVNIEIENKREDTIEVQAWEVSADGRMIDDYVFFSETVAGGKFSDATMKIENYDGDLPPMEENLEFILHVFSFDDFEFEDNTDVSIDFN